jgi:hypothetical protein
MAKRWLLKQVVLVIYKKQLSEDEMAAVPSSMEIQIVKIVSVTSPKHILSADSAKPMIYNTAYSC